MLSDDEFVDEFISESAKSLEKRHNDFSSGLEKVDISYLKSNAGLFPWMDLHKLLKEQTTEAEMALWRLIIREVKLNVLPCSSFHCQEPGWFRVSIANMDDKTMEVALTRIRIFINKELVVPRKKRCWQNNLSLRLSSTRSDDLKMSPHSPMPHSPMVRAT